MSALKILNRFQAFGIHLFISTLSAVLCYALVFLVWYPGLFAYASNVTTIFLLLLMVDVVIGPMITLVIYNPRKKELKLDLLIIGVLQVLALLYGLHTVFVVRPVYIVFNAGQFDLTYANDISEKNMALAHNVNFQSLPMWGPKLASVVLPDDPKLITEIISDSISGKDDIQTRVQYFDRYDTQKNAISASVKPLNSLEVLNKDRVEQLKFVIKKYKDLKIEAGYIPLKAKSHNLTVIVNRENAEILEMSDLKPWP